MAGTAPLALAGMGARLRVRLLDGFDVTLAGEPLVLSSAVQRLVALLGLHGPRPRSVAAALLWPDATEGRAAGNLRTVLWRLTSACRDVVDPRGHDLRLGQTVIVDTHDFVDTARNTLAGVTRRDATPLLNIPELLPGWYDDWVVDERDRLRQLAFQYLEAVSSIEADRQRYGLALEAAWQVVRADPLRESAHRAIIDVHLRQGNVAAAERHLSRVVALLREELGIGPSHLLTDLVRPFRIAPPTPPHRRVDVYRWQPPMR